MFINNSGRHKTYTYVNALLSRDAMQARHRYMLSLLFGTGTLVIGVKSPSTHLIPILELRIVISTVT